ncbi:hypothetical protein OG889_24875 [Streptomyces sp. NBC_00481]|uniref:hypothetical protein n=1 Tax=unclassified Streptomyces TaxID=2593676 RepID=UPI002DD88D3F|nr:MULTISPECIES: hypothetical protein [unclassified Streptomyces]WRY97656.1 hypothetical protein OG889_24875 [Streptomyces sp. NBC_00481]
MSWRIERTPGSRVHRTDGGRVAVPLRLSRNGEHATDAELVLSMVETEHLHASLCRALEGHPAPPSAPDCRSESLVEPVAAHRTGTGVR